MEVEKTETDILCDRDYRINDEVYSPDSTIQYNTMQSNVKKQK